MADAVKLTRPRPGVACLQMEERVGSNTFTEALVRGLAERLDEVGDDAETRVVVLHGYDSIFCAGGTLEELLDIADGRRSFDEGAFYRLLLDCPLPVIAAMQGHAVGGGLVFGLYADMVVMSRESLYGATFMKYGFTPGMGSTELLPRKLGPALASEMLFSARTYHGEILASRGIGFPVLPRKEVIPHALSLARDLADKPRTSLIRLKATLVASLREALPNAVQRERAMHEETFALDGIRTRIQKRYGQ